MAKNLKDGKPVDPIEKKQLLAAGGENDQRESNVASALDSTTRDTK